MASMAQQLRQASADANTHIIWGDVESSSGDPDNSLSHRSYEREQRKRLVNKKLNQGEVQMRSADDDGSVSNSSDGTTKPRAEAASSTAAATAHNPDSATDDVQEAEEEEECEYANDVQLGPLPSPGSAGHNEGNCKPCLLLFQTVGCSNGDRCGFCHYLHNRRKVVRSAARQSKGKRERFKKLLTKLEQGAGDVQQTPDAAAPSGAALRRSLMSL